MADDVRVSPLVLANFIKQYKSLPCLWNRFHPGYRTKECKNEALRILRDLLREKYPNATVSTALRKIDSIRSCHRKERTRIEKLRSKIKDPQEKKKLKSTLWYYDSLSFLNVKEARRSIYREIGSPRNENESKSENGDISESEEDPISVKKESEDEVTIDEDPRFDHTNLDNYPSEYGIATSMVEVSDSSSKQYSGFDDDLNKSGKRHCTEVEDEYDAIGINVAAKLRNLPPNMRILAEKLINDVLFQAQLNGLNANTTISTPDPFKQDPM